MILISKAMSLQIATCKHNKSGPLITADEILAQTRHKMGLETYHITKDEKYLKQQF
jgi:predicted nucleic acid-binding protein